MVKRTLHFSNPAHLSLRHNQLVIRPQTEVGVREAEITRPIEDIGVLIIESQQVTLTSALLSHLLLNNVAVVTCDNLHMPAGMMLNLAGNTLMSERFDAQVSASAPLKKQLWQQTVSAKINNQAAALRIATDTETGCMRKWAGSVKSGDTDNLEGRAAAYYWRSLFPAELCFRRDRFGAPPNHLLNYGYAILRAVIARSLAGSGLLPTLGIHHHNRYNAYCLADDIMEPYRPFVDLLVLDVIGQFGYDAPLDKEVKKMLLSVPVIDVRIDGRSSPLMVAASITTASLARCYLGEQRKIQYPEIQSL